MVGLIIGLLSVGGGIFFLIKKKKVPGLIMTIAGGVVALFGIFIMIANSIVEDEFCEAVVEANVADNALLDVIAVDGITAKEDKITYVSEEVTIVIREDNTDHSEDTVSGKTEDGIEWSTTDKEGTEDIHMSIDGKDVTAKVETKTDNENTNNQKADAGKAAEAVAALVDKTYKNGKDNYNHNYAIWYVEAAQCLVYYPAQLELEKVYEDNTAVFKDTMSKAELKISLDENNFTCMDDVESLIANTEFNKVLASGTDWYSCEIKGKSKTEYSLTGLGQEFAVNVDLTYENQYSFVFEELRSLIKCKFVEGGKWVSNEGADTVGKTVYALQSIYDTGIKYKLTQWYFADGDYIMIYPDNFSKVFYGYGGTCFTDPATGAYIKTFRQDYDSSIDALAIDYGLTDFTRIDEDIIRGYKDTEDYYKEYHYIVFRDSSEYHTIMYVPYAYDYLYQGAAAELSLKVPGDDIETFEMQDLYFKDYNCFVTVPLQFKYESGSGCDYYYYDSFNGLNLHIKFTKIPTTKNKGNIFDIFEVTAEDSNIIVGQNVVKWVNDDGLFLGGQGNTTACYAEIVAVDAERAYLKSWDRFNIRFEEVEKARSIVDEVKKDVKRQKIKEETLQEKPTVSEKPTGTGEGSYDNEETGEGYEDDEEPTEGAPINGESLNEGTAIVAEAVKNDLPTNDDWMEDGEQNVVLWYRSYEDYKFMCTDAGTWFKSEILGPYRAHSFKTDVLTYMVCILYYNEYEISINPDWISDMVPEVDAILKEWYYESDPPVGSMISDDITSVFEAFCQVLNIDVPDYVSNALEPSILEDVIDTDSNSASSQQSSGTYKLDVASLAGRWESVYVLAGECYYDLTADGKYYEYIKGIEGVASEGTFKVSGRTLELYKNGVILNHHDTWVYYPDDEMMMTKTYRLKLYRQEGTVETGSEGGDSYNADTDEGDSYEDGFGGYQSADNGIVWNDRFDGALSGINLLNYETTTDPLFERVWNTFEINNLIGNVGIWEYGKYGNASGIWFWDESDPYAFSNGEYGSAVTDLMNRLEALGLSYVGKGTFELPHKDVFYYVDENTVFEPVEYVEYSGTVSGLEEYGPLHVVISYDNDMGVSWMFENYSSFPVARGEMYVDESFVRFSQAFLGEQVGGALDAKTVYYICQNAPLMIGGVENNLHIFTEPYNNEPDKLYYVIVGDDDDGEWIALLVFYLDENNNPVYEYKNIKTYENGEWIDNMWFAYDGEWTSFK